jgi:hypothetical protein
MAGRTFCLVAALLLHGSVFVAGDDLLANWFSYLLPVIGNQVRDSGS